jgi:hypothetical protein
MVGDRAARGVAVFPFLYAIPVNLKVPFLVSTAELDPPSIIAFAETLKDQLCKAGRCPTYLVFKDHAHFRSDVAEHGGRQRDRSDPEMDQRRQVIAP